MEVYRMSALVVYDSTYGNTEKLARAMTDSITAGAKMLRASEVNVSDLESADLLIVGSPMLGGRPSQPVQNFLSNYSGKTKGLDVAAFDTRLAAKWVAIFGYAAQRIANLLAQSGAHMLAPLAGFFVTGREGPLKAGELEKAAN